MEETQKRRKSGGVEEQERMNGLGGSNADWSERGKKSALARARDGERTLDGGK